MKKLFITKDNIKSLIGDLKDSCDEFIAPKREGMDDIVFGDTKTGGGEMADYEGNSVISPRAFLLPQTEPLFEIKSGKDSSFIPIEDRKKRIFYGVRPCDIKALELMREFFLDEFIDIPYKQKMDNSVFIALACTNNCSSECFCCAMDSGPVAKDGFDLQLVPVARGYVVDIGSKKGEKIAKKNKRLFSEAAPSDEKEAKEIFKGFRGCAEKIDYKRLARIMKEDKVKPSVWDDIGLRCVVCSGCITLCPTCSCFSTMDRFNGTNGIRLRYCDGCPYAGFTKMAGGTTPFPQHKDHIRRFFEHKLNVDVERYGRPSCVGCGRCIQTCPGNISIRKFIEENCK